MKALDTIKRIKSQLDVDDVVEEVDGLKKKKNPRRKHFM
jgi:hypothetical protein